MKSLSHKKLQIIAITLVLLTSFVFAHQVWAKSYVISAIADTALSIIGAIFSMVIAVFGWLLTLIISGIIYIAQYNDFIYSPAVISGWKIMRDLCNMFFILILLVIAFATILRLEKYPLKKLLPKLILMAIFINFSKTICGLIIDAASVVMMTFVNGFSNVGGSGMTQMLGIDRMLSTSSIAPQGLAGGQAGSTIITTQGVTANNYTSGDQFWNMIILYGLAFVYMLVAVVVMIAMFGVLLTRMIMLWIYIIISPMAYVASILPSTSSMAEKWWKTFTSYVMTGPLLAFFIWLSLSTLNSVVSTNPMNVPLGYLGRAVGPGGMGKVNNSDITTTDFFIGYVIAIGLLVGGLVVSKEYGGLVGSAAGWGYKQIKDGAGWAKKQAMRPVNFAGKKAAQGAKATGRLAAAVGIAGVKGLDNMALGGKGGRTVGWVKDNLNRDGIRKTKDAVMSKLMKEDSQTPLWNSDADVIRQAVAINGSWKAPDGTVYKRSADGTITANGADISGMSRQDKGTYLPKVSAAGKIMSAELKPMAAWYARFKQGAQSSTMMVKDKAAKNKADAAAVDKFKGDYAGLDENQMQNSYFATTSANRRRAILLAAKDSGFTADWFNEDRAKFDEERKEVDKKNDYEQAFDDKLNGIGHLSTNALEGEYGNAPLDISAVGSSDPAKLKQLADKRAIRQKMKDAGIWDNYRNSLTAAGRQMVDDEEKFMDEENANIVTALNQTRQAEHDAISRRENLSKLSQFSQAENLFRNKPVMRKEFMESVQKHRPDLLYDLDDPTHQTAMDTLIKKGKMKIEDLKVNHLDISSLAKVLERFLKAQGRERYLSGVTKVDKEGSKELAAKIAQASLINAQGAESRAVAGGPNQNKDLQIAQSLRKDFVRLNGDVRKAFTKNGRLDKKTLKEFFADASPQEVSQIDVNSMDEEIAKEAAKKMTFNKLQQISRHGESPEVLNRIATAMVKMNHADADKIPQLNSGYKINRDAIDKNNVIREGLSNLHINVDIDDYDLINKFREEVEAMPRSNVGDYYKISSKNKRIIKDAVEPAMIAAIKQKWP